MKNSYIILKNKDFLKDFYIIFTYFIKRSTEFNITF